jgi:hypothetical protein
MVCLNLDCRVAGYLFYKMYFVTYECKHCETAGRILSPFLVAFSSIVSLNLKLTAQGSQLSSLVQCSFLPQVPRSLTDMSETFWEWVKRSISIARTDMLFHFSSAGTIFHHI